LKKIGPTKLSALDFVSFRHPLAELSGSGAQHDGLLFG
jgi:hypothetical protein